jgi:hypothetical protein
MIPEQLSPDRFAQAIAAWLDAVVPRGLSVRADGAAVIVYDPIPWGESVAAEILGDDDDRSVAERLETAARAIMCSAQDEIMESTREQWPLGPTGAANPDARVIGEDLQMWFGDEAAPILRLEPVHLADLANGAA